MVKILGFSGRLQSGKNTACNWILSNVLVANEVVSYAKIDEQGRLIVPLLIDGELMEGGLDPCSHEPHVQQFFAEVVWPICKIYAVADELKTACINTFGLSYQQVYGTNEQKNQPTKYTWHDFSRFLSGKTFETIDNERRWNAQMTARDIMQAYGTDMMREIDNNIWIDACINRITKEDSELALVSDVRFPNEVESIQAAGGKVIRFLRAPFKDQNQHASETALDDYSLEKYDAVIDNTNMSIPQQNEAVTKLIVEWGFNIWEYDQ